MGLKGLCRKLTGLDPLGVALVCVGAEGLAAHRGVLDAEVGIRDGGRGQEEEGGELHCC